ncbi:hypothetical protein G3488_21405 [Shewanella baltica]|uniref:hypothetical protein n=1 Tax=Shewanella baltica TaxID=62322 RepID=UPI00217D40AB|nr:hypothetical protein [Shewanella baltica]MCS6180297.1 hypothetical protein [Shewanella baltica]MCS6233377.1 hypothetical protein [Shewanella baltica]MCS6235988.1 hypothetical protein [Shewanella baltica]MCS6256351.1 hypothetical protein [Shewanella baltica]MCS6260274.1 hypothetical protein [Shewanella baltica]
METAVELTTFESLIRWTLLLLGGLPLLTYPGVLLASLMGLASQSSIKPAFITRLMNQCFLWGSLVYPAVYIPCYRIASDSTASSPLVTAALPLLYLILLYGCFRFMDIPIKATDD